MRAGDVIARDNGKVLVLAWKDKRVVKAISTKHDASTTTVTRRKKRGGGVMEEVSKPTCIVDYNKHMSGVDGLDQMISYYPFTRKSLKWTSKVFFYLVEIGVHNAYVLHLAQSRTKRYKHMSQFVLQLVKQLVPLEEADAAESGGEGAYTAQIYIPYCVHFATNDFFRSCLFAAEIDESPRPCKQRRDDDPKRLTGGIRRHLQTTFPPTAGKRLPSKPCRVCRKRGKRKDTRYLCSYCQVALCPGACYSDYHTKNVYA